MVPLAFIFCWRKHIFLLIIQKEPFLFDSHNLLRKNQSTQKWVKTCSKITLNVSYIFLENLTMWRQIWLNDDTSLIFPEIEEKLLASAVTFHERY